MINKNISNFLKQKMLDYSIDRQELSSKTNLSYNSIRNLEQGNKQNPSIDTILKIANYFGTSIDEVISNQKQKNSFKPNNISSADAMSKLKKFIKTRLQIDKTKPNLVAKEIGVGYETINDFIHPIPKKKSLSSSTVFKLSQYWEVSIDEMIGRTTPEQSKVTTQEKSALSLDITPDVATKLDKIKSSIAKNTQILKDASSTSVDSTKTNKPQSHVERLMQQRSKQSNNRER